MARVTGPVNPFDGCVYVVFRDDPDEGIVPLGATKYYGGALSLAGGFGGHGIERVSEGVWRGVSDGDREIWIYRMGVRH